MSNGERNSPNQPRGLMSGPRLIEMVVVTLFSAGISGMVVGYGTLRVLETEISYLRVSLDEARQEIKQLRRDLYRPYNDPDTYLPRTEMPVTFSDFRDDLVSSLHTAATRFEGTDADPDDDFKRFTLAATAALAERRGRTLIGSVDLVADQAEYTAPADLIRINAALWGAAHGIEPWDDRYPGPLPRHRIHRDAATVTLRLLPAPTRHQITQLGAEYTFYYAAGYWTGDPADDIELDRENDRELLLLRAQAEAAREMAIQNVGRPSETKIQMAQSKDMTARGLFDALIAEFDRRTGTGA